MRSPAGLVLVRTRQVVQHLAHSQTASSQFSTDGEINSELKVLAGIALVSASLYVDRHSCSRDHPLSEHHLFGDTLGTRFPQVPADFRELS